MNIERRVRAWAGSLTLLCMIATATLARQGNSVPPQTTTGPRIGQFQLSNPGGEIDVLLQGKKQTQTFELQGPRLTITSRRYDISAERMTMLQDTKQNVIVTATATGKVRINVRDNNQNIVLTCNRAVYRFAEAKSPTHIDVEGNVRGVIRDKLFTANDPLVITGESGVVEFLDADSTRIRMKSPSASGTPIEPEPKKPADKKTGTEKID